MAATLDALKFTTLADLDPRLDVLIQAHLKRTANDCMDRAREPGKRKVLVEFTFVPVEDPESGECDDVKMKVQVKSSQPVYRTKSYSLQPTKNGFLFNRESPENVRQQGLGFDERNE